MNESKTFNSIDGGTFERANKSANAFARIMCSNKTSCCLLTENFHHHSLSAFPSCSFRFSFRITLGRKTSRCTLVCESRRWLSVWIKKSQRALRTPVAKNRCRRMVVLWNYCSITRHFQAILLHETSHTSARVQASRTFFCEAKLLNRGWRVHMVRACCCDGKRIRFVRQKSAGARHVHETPSRWKVRWNIFAMKCYYKWPNLNGSRRNKLTSRAS